MGTLRIFKTGTIYSIKSNLDSSNGIEQYITNSFRFSESDILVNPSIIVPDRITLIMPGDDPDYEYKNSVTLYEAYKGLTPIEATDPRLWTYLTHTVFFPYMQRRRPVNDQEVSRRKDYIVDHWFVKNVSAGRLLRNDIAMLWWVAHLTQDESRADKYELTKEAFTMLDYTRHLLPGVQGRNREFAHAVLEYVVRNPALFSSSKEAKVRFIMRKLNRIAGYKVVPILTKCEIIELISQYSSQISATK